MIRLILYINLWPLAFYTAYAQQVPTQALKASIGHIPVVSEMDNSGNFVDYIRAMEAISGRKMDIKVLPFARSIKRVTNEQADFHFPLIEPPSKDKLPFIVSTASVYRVNFVIYSNKKKPLTVKDLENKVLETDAAHTTYFPFKITPSTCVECSLRKVNDGRIDAFIYADFAADSIVKKLNLKNINRKLYKEFEVKFILPKNEKSKQVDEYLSHHVNLLQRDGTWDRLIKPVAPKYSDWQP